MLNLIFSVSVHRKTGKRNSFYFVAILKRLQTCLKVLLEWPVLMPDIGRKLWHACVLEVMCLNCWVYGLSSGHDQSEWAPHIRTLTMAQIRRLISSMQLPLCFGWLCYSVSSFVGTFAKLQKATVSFVMSLCLSAWNSAAVIGWIFVKFDIWVFFETSVEKIQISLKSDKNEGYFIWRLIYVFDHISLISS